MKYEMIFGDAGLFDGASDGAVLAIKDTTSGRIHFFTNKGWIKSGLKHERHIGTSDNEIAMRRIIKEPKRWTWEDKKAGRLPDVGAELIHKTKGICYFVGVGLVENACWALKLQSGLIYIAEKSWCSPIETPSEKAQREEDEFVESTCRQNEPHSTLYSDGVRAAYRKLKGGE